MVLGEYVYGTSICWHIRQIRICARIINNVYVSTLIFFSLKTVKTRALCSYKITSSDEISMYRTNCKRVQYMLLLRMYNANTISVYCVTI